MDLIAAIYGHHITMFDEQGEIIADSRNPYFSTSVDLEEWQELEGLYSDEWQGLEYADLEVWEDPGGYEGLLFPFMDEGEFAGSFLAQTEFPSEPFVPLDPEASPNFGHGQPLSAVGRPRSRGPGDDAGLDHGASLIGPLAKAGRDGPPSGQGRPVAARRRQRPQRDSPIGQQLQRHGCRA